MVYRAVCHAFPQITSYGGWDAHGEHASGKAIDIMTSDKALGDQIAAFLQSHASELRPLRHHLVGADLDAGALLRGLARLRPTAGRPPPTT